MKPVLALTAATLLFQTSRPPNPAPSPLPPPFSITGRTSVPQNSLAQLTLTGATTNVAWLVMPPVSRYNSNQTLVFAAPPGVYQVVAVAVQGSEPVILQTAVTVTAAGSLPALAPTPTPPPALIPADPLSQAAIAYIQAIPAAVVSTSVDLSSGKIKTKSEVVTSIAAHRQPTVDAWVSQLDDAFSSVVDSSGTITNVPSSVSILNAASTAMRSVLLPVSN